MGEGPGAGARVMYSAANAAAAIIAAPVKIASGTVESRGFSRLATGASESSAANATP
jgi:hypothetical protein